MMLLEKKKKTSMIFLLGGVNCQVLRGFPFVVVGKTKFKFAVFVVFGWYVLETWKISIT